MDKIKKESEELDLNSKKKKYLLRKYIVGMDIKQGEDCALVNGVVYPVRKGKKQEEVVAKVLKNILKESILWDTAQKKQE